MAVASPTVQIAALAAFNTPASYVAGFIFPRCPIPGAAMAPGENKFRGKAYRVKKNLNRQAPGEVSLEMQPDQRPPRLFTGIEDYDLTCNVYHVDTPISEYAEPTMNRFGIENYESDVVAPFLVNAMLNDREKRVSDIISNTANFGGNASGFWADDNVDPIEQLDTAARAIEQGFGTLGPEHTFRLMMSDDAFRAFRNNAKVRARFRIVEDTPATPSEVSSYINKILTLEAGGGPGFEIRVAKATAATTNVGQNTSPTYLIANKAVLVVGARESTTPLTAIPRSAELQGRAEADLRLRSWGRAYTMLDPTISSHTDKDTAAIIYRGAHATTDVVYDSSGGYVWTSPATAS